MALTAETICIIFYQCLDLKNGWQIISAKKSFAVYAATRTEKAEWMAHINKCIQDLLAKSELSFISCFNSWYFCRSQVTGHYCFIKHS